MAEPTCQADAVEVEVCGGVRQRTIRGVNAVADDLGKTGFPEPTQMRPTVLLVYPVRQLRSSMLAAPCSMTPWVRAA